MAKRSHDVIELELQLVNEQADQLEREIERLERRCDALLARAEDLTVELCEMEEP